MNADICHLLSFRAVKFSSNDIFTRQYLSFLGAQKVDQTVAILAGSSAGAVEAVVVTPFELVKVRLQDPSVASRYTSVTRCVAQIVRSEGLFVLYQGFESTLWRHVVWNAGYFGSIFKVKAALPTPTTELEQTMTNFFTGAIGGSLGTLLNTPLDVVKTRIQAATRANCGGGGGGGGGAAAKYNWALPALVTLAREEGIRGLYKGLTAKLLRFCPGGGILLAAHSQILKLFEASNNGKLLKQDL
jgi:solute carrier family 25 2-oxodicarboxylate transporter 21